MPNAGNTIDLHRPAAWCFGLIIPVTVSGHDGEILLTGVLDRITGHVGIDTVLFTGKVATNTRQTFTRRRRPARPLCEQFGIPRSSLGRVEIGNRQILGGVDPVVGRCILWLNRDETNPEAIGQCIECQTGRALDQAHPCPVVGVPIGKILPLVARPRTRGSTDDHLVPCTPTAGGR